MAQGPTDSQMAAYNALEAAAAQASQTALEAAAANAPAAEPAGLWQGVTDILPPGGQPILSEAQALKMAANLVASGMDPEIVRAELDKAGIAQPETNPIQTQWDTEHLVPSSPYQSEQYHVDYGTSDGFAASLDTKTLVAANAEVTGFLAAIRIPPIMGNGLAEHMVSQARYLTGASDAEKQQYLDTQRSTWMRLPADQRAEIMANATFALSLAGSDNKFLNTIKVTGLLANDVFTLRTLATHGAMLAAWKAGRPK
jgi:hypothetical protein